MYNITLYFIHCFQKEKATTIRKTCVKLWFGKQLVRRYYKSGQKPVDQVGERKEVRIFQDCFLRTVKSPLHNSIYIQPHRSEQEGYTSLQREGLGGGTRGLCNLHQRSSLHRRTPRTASTLCNEESEGWSREVSRLLTVAKFTWFA